MIAIHKGGSWNRNWILYCEENGIQYKKVDCYSTNILKEIKGCTALLWLFHHSYPQDLLIARSVLNSAKNMGLKIFPDFYTNWHFDDKVAQKYLFESFNLPAPKAWVFVDKVKALSFRDNCDYPIVAKLKRGAGSYNVKLINNRKEYTKYVKLMFGKGISPSPSIMADAKHKVLSTGKKSGLKGVLQRLKKIPHFFKIMSKSRKYLGNEKGYCYFQEFMPNNSQDIRISVVGDRAWGYTRGVRKGDFRASGSGLNNYSKSSIPIELISKSFEVVEKLKMQSCCLDWVIDKDGCYYFVEVSMGFVDDYVYQCPGYWNSALKWYPGNYKPSEFVLLDILSLLE